MPVYDYRCQSCGRAFSRTEKIAEHERSSVRCPACQSEQIDRVLSAPYPRTARKS